jgi:alpha-glucosidase
VAAEAADPQSMLNLYRRLIALRKASPAFLHGAVAEVRADGGVLSYERRALEQRLAIYINLGEAARSIAVQSSQVSLSSTGHHEAVGGELYLAAGEGVVLLIEKL